jgi:nitroreductase
MSAARSEFASTQSATNDLWEAMYTMRAIRYFKPTPVPDELIWRVIEAGTMAPSGANRQPWSFVVVTDDELRRRIADAIRESYAGNEQFRDYVSTVQGSQDRSQRLIYTGVDNLMSNYAQAPVFVIPCVDSPPGEAAAAGAIAEAVQNLMLAARGLGLGTVLTTYPLSLPELRELLALPDDVRPVAFVPMGYPDRNFGPLNRKPVQTVTHWNRWGEMREHAGDG